MSRNYDNWERLVAAVLKRDQIWHLCHQDSISICSESSWDSEFSLPVSLESFGIVDTFKFETSNLATLSQNLQEYFGRGPKSVVRLLDDDDELVKMLLVARRCLGLAELTLDRPTMSDVVLMLDTIRYKQDVSRDFIPQKRRVWQKFLPFSKR